MKDILVLLREAENQIAAAQRTLEKIDTEKAGGALDACANHATSLESLETSLREKKTCFLAKLADAALAIRGDEYVIKACGSVVRLCARLNLEGKTWFGVGFATCYPASFTRKDNWAKYFWPVCENLVSVVRMYVEKEQVERIEEVKIETQVLAKSLQELMQLQHQLESVPGAT